MKVCIVSDSHDRGELLARAIERAQAWGALAVLHCGDIIGPSTLKPALTCGLPLHVIHGNNVGDPPVMMRLALASGGLLTYHGGEATLELGGRRLFMIHYPHLARGMATTGDYDAVLCGHSHEARIEQVPNVRGGATALVNPGTVAGLGAPATMVLGDLGTMSFEVQALA